jgi:hypothetical protein
MCIKEEYDHIRATGEPLDDSFEIIASGKTLLFAGENLE